MPFLLPDFHSNAIIRRWRTYENIPCLLYWLLSVIDINHACSKIFICSNLFFFGIVYNFCYLSYDNRTCESSESRSGLPREPYLHAEDIPHTATQPYMCCIFIYIKSTRYMFLQALVFFIIFVTSLIGRLLYKD